MRRQGTTQTRPDAPEAAPLKKVFARVLREIRTQRGVSQEDLGFESGYHRTYIGLLERGQMNPSLQTILSIAAALGIRAAEIVQRVEEELGPGWRRSSTEARPRAAIASNGKRSKTKTVAKVRPRSVNAAERAELQERIAAIRSKLEELEEEALSLGHRP